ncbi:MAG: Lrp/AsnC ligand binding domain-containing protein, partial [Candidatus Bathyarchaeia archaeon]
VLIKTIPTRIEETLAEVKKFKQVKKAYMVFGRWDIVAFMEVSEYKELKDITSEINRIKGVRSTETLAST